MNCRPMRWPQGSDALESVTDLYLITLLFLFPLFPGFSGYSNITFSKYVFLLAATGLYLAGMLVTAQLSKSSVSPPKLRAPQWAAIAFLVVCAISALLSTNLTDSLLGAGRYDGLLTIAVYVIIFFCASQFTHPKLIHAYALGAAALLCCCIGVLQLLGGNPLGLYPGDLRWQDAGIRYSGTYLGTIGNTNLQDAMLCLVIPMCAVLILRAKKRLFILPLLLSLCIVVFAGGSGAAAALCAAVLAGLVVLPRKKQTRIACCIVAAVLLIAAFLLLRFYPGDSGTLYELSQVLQGHVEDSYGSSRIRIWRECLALVKDRPLLGYGPGTLALHLHVEFSRYVPDIGETLRSSVDNAHNVYLGYLLNTGVLGLAAYLIWLLLTAIRTLRLMQRSALIAAFALAVFCGAAHAFFGLGLFLTEPMFFALLGLCCCAPSDSNFKEALQ